MLQLTTGYRDSVNGYGWFIEYDIKIFRYVEYCSKCRDKFGVNYKDDVFMHRHKHEKEFEVVFAKKFMDSNKMLEELNNFVQSSIKQLTT